MKNDYYLGMKMPSDNCDHVIGVRPSFGECEFIKKSFIDSFSDTFHYDTTYKEFTFCPDCGTKLC